MDPHCFDADPAHNLDADPDPDPDPGGGERSAKNVHPPWQNPRYAPACGYIRVKNCMRTIHARGGKFAHRYVPGPGWQVLCGGLASLCHIQGVAITCGRVFRIRMFLGLWIRIRSRNFFYGSGSFHQKARK